MQSFLTNETAGMIPVIFWAALIGGGLVWAFMYRTKPDANSRFMLEQNVQVLMRSIKDEEDLVKTVKRVTLAVPSEWSKSHKGRAVLPALQYVDFNPADPEHCIALRLLMENPARQHPTARFHYDTSTHDSAYGYILSVLVNHDIDRVMRNAKPAKPRATKVVKNPEIKVSTVVPPRNLIELRRPEQKSNP
jgi:hypothetical protein